MRTKRTVDSDVEIVRIWPEGDGGATVDEPRSARPRVGALTVKEGTLWRQILLRSLQKRPPRGRSGAARRRVPRLDSAQGA